MYTIFSIIVVLAAIGLGSFLLGCVYAAIAEEIRIYKAHQKNERRKAYKAFAAENQAILDAHNATLPFWNDPLFDEDF